MVRSCSFFILLSSLISIVQQVNIIKPTADKIQSLSIMLIASNAMLSALTTIHILIRIVAFFLFIVLVVFIR